MRHALRTAGIGSIAALALTALAAPTMAMAAPDQTGGAIRHDDYAIYLWDGESKVDRLYGLKAYGKETKPEALLPLEGDAEQVRLLLMFDGPDEGEPTPLSIKLR